MGRLPSPVESSERNVEEGLSLAESGVLFEFRAGKMNLNGTQVRADPRKGVVRIVKTDDTLVHFQWCDSTTNVVEDDQIVFPDEAVFEKVQQSSGRVYLLKFKFDDRRYFYWMQGRRPEDDETFCEVVKIHLNQPLGNEELEEEAPPEGDWDTEAGGDASRDVDMTNVLSEVESPSTDAVQASDLQRILRNLQQTIPQGTFAGAIDEDQYLDTGPSFSDIFKPDLILPFMDQKVLEEQLSQYLPEGIDCAEDLEDLIRSPPFQQQLDAFTRVLRSGQLDWAQFGVDSRNYICTVSSFLEALENQTSVPETRQGPSGVPQEEGRSDVNVERAGGPRDDQRSKSDDDVMGEGI